VPSIIDLKNEAKYWNKNEIPRRTVIKENVDLEFIGTIVESFTYKVKDKRLPKIKSIVPINRNATKLEDNILFILILSFLNSATYFSTEVPKPKSRIELKPQIDVKRIQIPNKSLPKCFRFSFNVNKEEINKKINWADNHIEFFLSEDIMFYHS
jgi:chorismate mutase